MNQEESCDIDVYHNRFSSNYLKLKDAGGEIQEKDLLMIFINGVATKYGPIIGPLIAQEDYNIKLEDFWNKWKI